MAQASTSAAGTGKEGFPSRFRRFIIPRSLDARKAAANTMRKTAIRFLRELLTVDTAVAESQNRVAEALEAVAMAVDRQSETINQRLEEMGTNLQTAIARMRQEITDERNIFIAATKALQVYADQVRQVASQANDETAAALNAMADDMQANAGPLAQAIAANTPAAAQPMAPSPAVREGSGDGVSATLPRDQAGGGGAAATRTAPWSTTPVPASPSEGDKVNATAPDGTSKTFTFTGGRWMADDGTGYIDPSTDAWTSSSGAGATGGGTGAGVAPKEGDTRTDPVTGKAQTFRNGSWTNDDGTSVV
jgi:hypothetical protein